MTSGRGWEYNSGMARLYFVHPAEEPEWAGVPVGREYLLRLLNMSLTNAYNMLDER